jgi:hypothetical protein
VAGKGKLEWDGHLGKVVEKGGGGLPDISRKVTGVGQLCLLFFSGFLIQGSHVCIVSVFLDILAAFIS